MFAEPKSTFYFEASRKTFCKGFGPVVAYFVEGTKDPPPKDLLQMLGVEHRVGDFVFHNPVGGTAAKVVTMERHTSSSNGCTDSMYSTAQASSTARYGGTEERSEGNLDDIMAL